MANGKIIERILREAECPGLLEALAERLSPTDLQSLMLEAYRRRANKLSPSRLLERYQNDPLVQPAKVRPRAILEFDRLAFELLPTDFDVIQLSPVCPLGTTSVIAPIDQNWIVSTAWNTELCSDATNVLGLECARRRTPGTSKASLSQTVTKLCCSHRVLRTQERSARLSPHFQILSLVTAGRDSGSFAFEIAALREHVDYYVRLLEHLRDAGFQVNRISVYLTAFNPVCYEAVDAGVLRELARLHTDVNFEFRQDRQQAKGYYQDVAFHVCATDAAQTREYELADGGNTDWTQQLLNNKKERFFSSGIGSERVIQVFGATA